MKEMRRILALVLCFVMLVGILPVSAFATDTVPAETSVVETTEAPTSAVEDDDVADDDAQSTPADSSTVPADTSTAPADTTTAPADNTLTKATPDANAGIALASNEEDGIAVAANDPVVVIAASDYQRSDSGTIMTNIMNQIKKDYSSPYGALMGGDYDAGSVNTKASHIVAVNDTISGVFPNIASDKRIYLQGNHENYANLKVDGTNLMDESGEHDTEYYGVYAINHDDFPWTTSTNPAPSETLVKATADALGDYLEEKASANYKKPIFVMSHLPLHVTRGDNRYAKLIFDELEAAGAAGLNIIFLVGHNHSGGYDQYLGNGSVYLPKGSSLTVVNGTNSSYTDSSISFTYMNYGYLGKITGSACTHQTMTAFEITDTQVTIKRYDVDGQHLLKAAGVESSGDPDPDENEYGYAVLSLSDGKSTTYGLSSDDSNAGSGDDSTGSGDNSGTTGGTVYTLDTDGIDAGEDYLIVSTGSDGTGSALTNNSGSSTGTDVTISGGKITLDNANAVWIFSDAESGNVQNGTSGYYVYPSSNSASIIRNEECALTFSHEGNGEYVIKRSINYGYMTTTSYVDGSDWSNSSSEASVYLFKKSGTGSGGGSTVTPEGGDWVTISSGVGGTIYTLTDTLEAGKEYLIVSANSGSGYALQNPGVSSGSVDMGATAVDIQSGTTAYITTDATDIVWTAEESDSVIKLINDGDYLEGKSGGVKIYSASQYSDRGWEYESNQLKYTGGRNTYIVYYDGGFTYTYGSTSNKVYLFAKTGTESAGDAEYAKLDGELTYTIDRGLNSDAALAEVMKGINVVVSADKSAETILEDTNDNITWELASNYDGTVAGEYAVTISYKGVKLGTAKVIVPAVNVDHIACDESGSVKADATGKVRTGANITVYYEDGTTQKIPVTVDMLKDADGNAVDTTLAEDQTSKTITGLKVYYNGECVCENFTLTVRAPSSYPEYPDEGAVQVKKTAKGVQFQSTGVAQVEVSASGIPMNQGVDVLLILDTSSSMGEAGSLTSGTRMSVLKECVNALIQSLKAERADGSVPDVDFSVVDFAGYLDYKTINYIESAAKDTSDDKRGAVLLDWTNVQNVSSTWGNGLTEKSGTNYDHGLQMGYDQLSAKQQEDEGSRKQFVLFMSDGAPFQYNGVGSSEVGKGNAFEKWLLGTYTQDEVDALKGDHFNNPEFYYESEGGAQKNRIAEAIKGSANETFYIPSYTQTNGTWKGELVGVPGLGATMYSVGYALVEDYGKNPTGLDSMNAILKTIASTSEETGEKLFYSVKVKEDLEACFDDFAGEALMAATNARFVDQMGDHYNLKMGQIKDLKGNVVEGVENKIEIISYDIWTRSDYLAGKCTADKIGDRKSTFTVLETITFNADGTEVYSDKIDNGQTNILGDGTQEGFEKGVIYAKNFMYNANTDKAVPVNGVSIPTGVDENGLTTGETNMLPAETFYWYLGTIKTTELAMRYYVYLDGSMEGTCEAGSYPTNEYANLYYNNYLNQPVGQPCQKTTVSPVMAWDAANVSYAFYLVDDNGNIIVNQTTGETGPFSRKVPVTNPVVYREVLLNNTGNVESIEVASLGVLPDGYELYDPSAVYTIEIKSDATGSWNIVKGTDKATTTYVTHYDFDNIDAYTNELDKNSDADFTHTIVWFAVKWKVQALPDTVVIDYGLPVDISVLTNDMFGENGKLAGVGAYSDTLHLEGHDTDLANGFGNEYKASTNSSDMLSYGDVEVRANGKVRYTPSTMEMNGYDKFAYAAQYTGATNPGYYYDTVTVIPATTVYYEDNFLTYTASNTEWEDEGTAVENATQAEDRPGQYSLTDANNIYGYDAVNKNMSTFSLGTAKKVTVDADSYATAEFTFTGTGFDVVSMTTSDTGVLVVQVYSANGELETSKFVNTYYGVVYDETTGKWVATANGVAGAPDKIYQVPVIQVNGLTYGQYTVKLTASYYKNFDEQYSANEGATNSYDLYLDAVRIYDPTGNQDATVNDAYVKDGEGWPTYFELRDHIITANSFGNVEKTTVVTGSVFIDGDLSVGDDQIDEYVSYGPNNEIYLAKDQRIAFMLGGLDNVENVHLGIKSADGKACNYSIKNIAQNTNNETGVTAGASYGEKISTVATTTDMYYNLTSWKNDIIVITNTGSEGVLSLTNIKFTYATNPYGAADASVMTLSLEDEVEAAAEPVTGYAYMTSSAAALTLRSLNASVEEEEVPETTVPETTVPEETEPETEETKPSKPGKPNKEDKPGKGEKPEKETKPGKEDKPNKNDKPAKNDRAEEVRNNLNKAAAKIKNLVTALLGKWFR